ncbi:MAG: TldD/PmbA family protein [Defluviitaleaceae bacterium]|nr:TldD/PmbA family protein [Defluviitaleaceae bacterium]
MKYVFPKGLFADVRIEHIFATHVSFMKREMKNCREQKYSAAFVRVFDGKMWYYSSTTDLGGIQGEIDSLAKLAEPNSDLAQNEVFKRLGSCQDTVMSYIGNEASSVDLDDKINLLRGMMPKLETNDYIKLWNVHYIDKYMVKEYYNSKGAALKFDTQKIGIAAGFDMKDGEQKMDGFFQQAAMSFSDLFGYEAALVADIEKTQKFLLESEPVVAGRYPVIFAPKVTGVFVHECFGHKSESDFMIGDEATRKEWEIGKKIGPDNLNIIESGNVMGTGYTPYDDEGNKATTTYLVKNGVLTGRLHNAASAADLGEEVTGNARALNFEFEPVVRMTTTYIDKGTMTYDEMIASTKDGILITDYNHGQGMSTFTIAPSAAYTIKDGKIDKPVRVSVVTGNVFEALGDIDCITDKVEIKHSVMGGCGKMAQGPLATGMGGPYIRVANMMVQ